MPREETARWTNVRGSWPTTSAACTGGLYRMPELCARYTVSRKTGSKWPARYAAEGPAGLHARSHVPHGCPHAAPVALAELLEGTGDGVWSLYGGDCRARNCPKAASSRAR